MKKFIWNIIKFLRLGPLVLWIHPKSALQRSGWFKSFHLKKVIDENGNPIPWWTYPAIDFLKERLSPDFRVLEFGCGGSTIWLSKRVKEVISLEDFPDWAAKIRNRIPATSRIIEVKDIEDHSSYRDQISGEFDILIIDNLGSRIKCLKNNVNLLNDRGIVIWDNTDGPDWDNIRSLMISLGFREISFSGMVAQEFSYNRTTIFYKNNNCLEI